MRLFAALPLPANARREFARTLAELRGADWPVRWVRDDLAHVTLKFYGEVLPDRRAVIEEALTQAVAGTGPMMLRFDALGAFPTFRRPRVVWLGLEAPPALELLKDRVERTAEGIGFAPEGVPFRAHVTLGRVREGQRLPPGALEQWPAAPFEPFMVDQAVLFESTLTPQGAEYAQRLTIPLAT